MNATISKILGWVLLIAGIIIIAGAAYSTYNIFTGQSKAPEIFKMAASKVQSSTQLSNDIQKQIEGLLQNQIKDLLPQDAIPKILNLIVWSILAGILILVGGQISSLGIKLVK